MQHDERQPGGGYFSIPQVLLICAFAAGLASLAGWTLNIEVRKADRTEIVGSAFKDTINMRLGGMEYDLRYIRDRLDKHMSDHGVTQREPGWRKQ